MKRAELKRFEDPCIPDHICGLTIFDFVLTFLPSVSFILFFTAFVSPFWGLFTVKIDGMIKVQGL